MKDGREKRVGQKAPRAVGEGVKCRDAGSGCILPPTVKSFSFGETWITFLKGID